MKRLSAVASALFLATALGACHDSDFLYYRNPAPPQVESVSHKIKEIAGTSRVDIIWQVGGMTELKDTLVKGADTFINLMTQQKLLDWRLGVISTDPANQPFIGFTATDRLESTTPNAPQLFHDAVTQVINAYDGEQMMVPVKQALDQHPTFLRQDAILVLIVTNDNPDLSDGIKTDDFLKYLGQLKGDLSKVIIYGVLGTIDFSCPRSQIDDDWNYKASTYETVVNATHGKAFSLCTADFGTSLGKIGDDFIQRLNHPRIYLKSRPVPSTIRVSFHDQDLQGGPQESGGLWSYDFELNAVVFYDLRFASADTEQVDITYTIDGT